LRYKTVDYQHFGQQISFCIDIIVKCMQIPSFECQGLLQEKTKKQKATTKQINIYLTMWKCAKQSCCL